MKKAAWTMVVALITSCIGTCLAQSRSPKLTAEFSGASLKWIHAAESEFEKRHLDLDKYIVVVGEQNESVVVALRPSDAAKDGRGSTGSLASYEVEIRKKDLSVIRSNYVR